MDTLQALMIIVPSLIVLAIVYVMMRGFLEGMKNILMEDYRRRKDEIKVLNHQATAPLRFQANERMVLFLERISPANLVMRLHKSGMSGHQLHVDLIQTIRSEYEHNLSQQLYLSIGAWELIKTAKEETAKLINMTAEKVPATATGLDFAQAVIELASKLNKLPTDVAIEYLKKEFAENF